MRVAERNRAIKRALAKEFGYKNVSVTGDTGTAYGWVDIVIKVKDPCNGFDISTSDDMSRINECSRKRAEIADPIIDRVWEILRETGLEKELGIYWNDSNEQRYECIVRVEFV
jgi:hypothetical protein